MPSYPNYQLAPPVLVALSEAEETRWGVTQFPAYSSLPDGRILLTYADAEDSIETHGAPAPSYVSDDDGQTWRPLDTDLVPTRPHFAISPVYHGEYFALPTTPHLDIKEAGVALPDPSAESTVYGRFFTYRLSDFSSEVREHFASPDVLRWTPATQKWTTEQARYDIEGMLAWRRENSNLLPRVAFEQPLLKYKGELLCANYRARYACPDGFVPSKSSTSLMVSNDNGHTFKRRASIAVDREGKDLYGEPTLAETADGQLICAIRKTDHQQKPLVLTFSSDDGHTWTPPEKINDFGVFPYLLRLSSGPLILSYGRPGVWIRINEDGLGKTWSDPICIIEGDPNDIGFHTCGYTSLHALGPKSFLITYSDFDHRDENGVPHKAILSRRIDLE